MTPRTPTISGTRKAAILMAIMGEEAASAVFRHLSDKDVQVVTKELADLKSVAPELAHEILEEYSKLALTQDYLAEGGIDFATRSLVKAFGEDNAQYLLKQVVRLQQMRAGQLDSLA